MKFHRSSLTRTLRLAPAYFALVILLASACSKPPGPTAIVDQDLLLTMGGFMRDNADAGTLTGECRAGSNRQTLECEIYNGIQGWTVTQVSLQVEWAPALGGSTRLYRVPAEIKPFTSQKCTATVESPLPADTGMPSAESPAANRRWSWSIVGARGYRAQRQP